MNSLSGITDLSFLANMTKLEMLGLGSCNGLNGNSFQVFSQQREQSGNNISSVIMNFPSLTYISLHGCKNIDDESFEHLSRNKNLCQNLKSLNLGMNNGVTKKSFECYISQLKRLGALMLSRLNDDLDAVTARGLLKNHLKNLPQQ